MYNSYMETTADKLMSEYIHLSKYSRWLAEDVRREVSFAESVDRLREFWKSRLPSSLLKDLDEACDSMVKLEVMASMRTLMTAGPALEKENMAGFNCAAHRIDSVMSFAEMFYILMCGTGDGFSVERQYITKMLPDLPEALFPTETTIVVHDSRIGWAKAIKQLMTMLYSGEIPKWDLSKVRPEGARLKTFGGRASGPGPLNLLMGFIVSVFSNAVSEGKNKLNSLECHDICCMISDTVLAGSVRRAATISFSNLTDQRMAKAKRGDFPKYRHLANNSVAYTEKPDMSAFLLEMLNLLEGKNGERGIVNKNALHRKAEATGREHKGDYLLNPCGEAILRDTGGLCNLSEVVIRPTDNFETVLQKVKLATFFGTIQSTLENFNFVRKVWTDNQKEERLLGVSLTGIQDHPFFSARSELLGHDDARVFHEWFGHSDLRAALVQMKLKSIEENARVADIIGINHSKQRTLVKPSGTVSQLVGCSSGIHPRYSPYYLRRVTQDPKDPLTYAMIDAGIPYVEKYSKYYFSFPIKSPEDAVTVKDVTALEQLELWKIYQEHWCEGNPSCTIYYHGDEFLKVISWVHSNWDIIGGLSFFPVDDFDYDKDITPYLEITQEEYYKALQVFPTNVEWESLLSRYEVDDGFDLSTGREISCAGGKCEF